MGIEREIDPELCDIDFHELHLEKTPFSDGAYSKVYKATYKGTVVCAKLIPKDMDEDDELFHLYVEREIQVSQMLDHPNIVKHYGAGQDEKYYYLLTEYVPGGNMRSFIKHQRGLPWDLKVHIAIGLAQGLQHMHAKNVLHRDIKSENILVGDNWQIKICDFGFAKVINGDISKKAAHSICGTEEYMAPEMLMGLDYNDKVDIFAYGIFLAELLTQCYLPTDLVRTPATQFGLNGLAFKELLTPDCPLPLAELVIDCCSYVTSNRPSLERIVHKLYDIKSVLPLFDCSGNPKAQDPHEPTRRKFRRNAPAIKQEEIKISTILIEDESDDESEKLVFEEIKYEEIKFEDIHEHLPAHQQHEEQHSNTHATPPEFSPEEINHHELHLQEMHPDEIELDEEEMRPDNIQLQEMHPDEIELDEMRPNEIEFDEMRPDEIELDETHLEETHPEEVLLDEGETEDSQGLEVHELLPHDQMEIHELDEHDYHEENQLHEHTYEGYEEPEHYEHEEHGENGEHEHEHEHEHYELAEQEHEHDEEHEEHEEQHDEVEFHEASEVQLHEEELESDSINYETIITTNVHEEEPEVEPEMQFSEFELKVIDYDQNKPPVEVAHPPQEILTPRRPKLGAGMFQKPVLQHWESRELLENTMEREFRLAREFVKARDLPALSNANAATQSQTTEPPHKSESEEDEDIELDMEELQMESFIVFEYHDDDAKDHESNFNFAETFTSKSNKYSAYYH